MLPINLEQFLNNSVFSQSPARRLAINTNLACQKYGLLGPQEVGRSNKICTIPYYLRIIKLKVTEKK